ncbi:MAG: HlyD family secretion protein [Candidatus Latescibacteria bacterium]|nr:HlyD family secretion protein [Candidatus Latescibacterota bacterium]
MESPTDQQPLPTATPPRRPPLALVVAILLALGGILAYRYSLADEEDTDDAQVIADTVPVATRVGGQVHRLLVQENQLVEQGALLAEIDDADYAARAEKAEAELATAQAQARAADAQVQIVEASARGGLATAQAALASSNAGAKGADANLESARAALEGAEAAARRAEQDLSRARQLREANALPQDRLDAAQFARDAAQATLAQAKAKVTSEEESRRAAHSRIAEAKGRLDQSTPIAAQIEAARAGAELAHARVRSAEAALALARLELGYTRITAPATGSASKLTVHEGQLISPGQPLCELVPTATYVIANFKETQISQMKPGQPAEITIDAFPGQTLTGRVESLSGGTGASFSLLPADNATGNFVKVVQRVPVRIAWTEPRPALTLRAGLSAVVTVQVGN